MLLGAQEPKPAQEAAPVVRKRRADSAPKRERREASAPQSTLSAKSSGRPDWATRVFGN